MRNSAFGRGTNARTELDALEEELTSGLEARFQEIDARWAEAARDLSQDVLEALGLIPPRVREAASWFDILTDSISGTLASLSGILKVTKEFGAEAAPQIQDAYDERTTGNLRESQDEAIAESRRTFDEALSDARSLRNFLRTMDREQANFARQRRLAQRDFDKEMVDSEKELDDELLKLQDDYNKDNIKRTKDYAKEIERIERDTRENVLQAARQLDATGVNDAYRQGAKQLADLKDKTTEEQQERSADYVAQIKELRENHTKQRNERRAQFAQQQADELEQYELRRQQAIDDRNLQLADEAEDRDLRRRREIEDRALREAREWEDFKKRITRLVKQVNDEHSVWSAWAGMIASASASARNSIASIFSAANAYSTRTTDPRVYSSPTSYNSPIGPNMSGGANTNFGSATWTNPYTLGALTSPTSSRTSNVQIGQVQVNTGSGNPVEIARSVEGALSNFFTQYGSRPV